MTTFDLLHTIVGNGHRAPRHAPMTATGKGKYYTVHQPLTDDQIAAHLTGSATYAVPLIGTDTLASAGLIEQDAGGIDSAHRILAAAEARGVIMFAIVCTGSGGHDGCHPWALYDGRYDPAAIRAQLQPIAIDAGASTDEIHPNNTNIRLPFGLHLRSHTRGRLVLQSGETYDLDEGDQLRMGEAAVLALPLNSAPPKVEIFPPLQPVKVGNISYFKESPGERGAAKIATGHIDTRAIFTEAIKRFNADNPDYVRDWLGTADRSGNRLCPCAGHSSGKPNIAVWKDANGIDRAQSYSSDCTIFPLHKSRAYIDPFAAYVLQEHGGNAGAAKETLARQYGLWVEPRGNGLNQSITTEPARYTDEQKAAWRASKNAANAAAAAECRDFCSAYAATDARLAPCDRVTVRAMLGWAAAHNSSTCMMGRASLARVTGYSLGSIKRSVMRLEALGYFASEGKGGRPIDTARRNFSRGSLFEDRTILEPKNDPRIVYKLDLVQESVDLVSAPPAPACENVYAASIEDWAWCADEHSADELSALGEFLNLESFPKLQKVGESQKLESVPNSDKVGEIRKLESFPNSDKVAILRQSYGRHQVSDGARFGGWAATEAGAWETWSGTTVTNAVTVVGGTTFDLEPEVVTKSVVSGIGTTVPDAPGASYMPVELPEKPYSGRNKHAMDTAARYALVWETMRRRDDADVADQAETANFADTPTPKPRQQSDTPRAIDRYLVELAGMSESALAGELKKHRATLKKHSGAKWLSGIRDRLALVEHEIDDRGSSTRPNERRGSQAPARRLAPSAGVQAAFI